MPDPISAIIENVASTAFETDTDPGDTNTTPEIPAESTDTPALAEGETGLVTEPGTETPSVLEPQDELTAELEALGIKVPREGERENRLPYSRIKKIFGNAQKKWVADHANEITERETRLTKAQERLQNMDNVDRLIEADPDRYIGMLAALHPEKYKKFISSTSQETREQPQKVVPTEPMPQPDTKFDDGSVGYSPEGLNALMDWRDKQTEQRVTAKLEEAYTKRFGPIEREWQSNKVIQEQIPHVKAQTESARKRWGSLFEAEERLDMQSPLLKYMQDNPQISFDAACADYFLPKIRTGRETMRSELLKEINERPKAAVKSVPGITSESKSATGPRSIEDIIAGVAASLGTE